MSQNSRPGGLVALAILNFLFAAIGFISVVSSILSLVFKDKMIAHDPNLKGWIESISVFYIASSAVLTVFLIVSGVGYLMQKKILGFVLGNVAAIVWVIHLTLSSETFNIINSALLLLPVLTLVMLNVVFKKDFINP